MRFTITPTRSHNANRWIQVYLQSLKSYYETGKGTHSIPRTDRPCGMSKMPRIGSQVRFGGRRHADPRSDAHGGAWAWDVRYASSLAGGTYVRESKG